MSTIKYIFFLIVSFIWANIYLILLVGVLVFLLLFLLVSIHMYRLNAEGYFALLKGVGISAGMVVACLLAVRYAFVRLFNAPSYLSRFLGFLGGLLLASALGYFEYTRFLHTGVLSAKAFYAEFLSMIQQFRA